MQRLRIALALVAVCPLLASQEAEPAKHEPGEPASEEVEPIREQESVTHHTVTIAGKEIAYTARAATLPLEEEDGTLKANLFYVEYTRDDVEDRAQRPIMFCFNGGPGSSLVWLHLGVFGPRRVKLTDEGWATPPPYELVDNEYGFLDLTDLVFIDPVTTGYSRAAEGVDSEEFHGVDEDVKWVAEFIRLYTTRNERWESPKFLAGESYGTTRAAGLAGELQEHHGMFLNGIVMVSAILNFQTARFDRGNDLPYILFLPTYTATAWYHGRLDADLQQDLRRTLDEVEDFALGDYTVALMKGDDLSAEERDAIAERLARYTGLSAKYVLQTDLRVQIGRFCKELLRDEEHTTGRLDSRFIGTDYDSAGERYDFDPSYANIQGPFTAAFNHYVRADLGFESNLPYEILTGRVQPWSYGEARNRYVNVSETLRGAMTRNPGLRVFVANGYYDLATPYFATKYTFDHLGLDPDLRGNVSMGYYEAGHMMYIRRLSLVRFKRDVGAFLRAAASQ
ncbi:MAG: peptidase S10 [Planctomycetota bacterium]|nr:peptidase S10 [Planctomycetota bacterium]